VTATFSEPLTLSTVGTATVGLKDSNNAAVAVTVAYAGTTATLTPLAPLAFATSYTVTIAGGPSGVKDLAGNPLATSRTWTFKTMPPPDTTPPIVMSITPPDGAVSVDVHTGVEATFSELIAASSVTAATV